MSDLAAENCTSRVAKQSRNRRRGVGDLSEPARRRRARRTNDPLATLSTNTSIGRRTADLVRAYLRALGLPADIGTQARVITAAELQVLAEETRRKALHGEPVDPLALVRLQGAADRALRGLGLKVGPADQKPLSLRDELIAEIEAEDRARAEADRSPDLTATSIPSETKNTTSVPTTGKELARADEKEAVPLLVSGAR